MDTQLLINASSAVTLAVVLIIIWVLFKIHRLDRIRKEFLSSDMGKDLEQVLVEQNRTITKLKTDLIELNNKVKDLTVINQSNFQKIGFVRFNPFDDAGGNISFVLSLLNAKDDGVVISSLHGRDGTRIYAKAVKNGKSESKLTEEELSAIKDAHTT